MRQQLLMRTPAPQLLRKTTATDLNHGYMPIRTATDVATGKHKSSHWRGGLLPMRWTAGALPSTRKITVAAPRLELTALYFIMIHAVL